MPLTEYNVEEEVEQFLQDADSMDEKKFRAWAELLSSKPSGWFRLFLKRLYEEEFGKVPSDEGLVTPELLKEKSTPNHIGPGWDYSSQPFLEALRIRATKALRKVLLGRWEVLEYLEVPEVALVARMYGLLMKDTSF